MLPGNASLHSQKLFASACGLLKTCPPALYEEMAVSGSVARGIADQYSDCEVGIWTSTLQPAEVYKTWLESRGSNSKLMRESPDGDTALYLEYNIDGVKICTVWQTWDKLEAIRTALQASRLPESTTDTWMLSNLLPIGDTPRLKAYRVLVAQYPDTLRRNVIEDRLRTWRWLMGVADIFIGEPAARRGQLYDLRRRQLLTIRDIFFMLFAYNRMWLPDAKWYTSESAHMPQKPSNLIERVDTLLTERDPYTLLETMRRLQVETLKLLSDDFDVQDIISGLEAIDIQATS